MVVSAITEDRLFFCISSLNFEIIVPKQSSIVNNLNKNLLLSASRIRVIHSVLDL